MTVVGQMSDLEIKRIASRLVGCTIGHQFHLFETLESTMDKAKKFAEDGAPEGTVVITEEQTAGRGRFDRSWISDSRKDLLFSVVFRPDTVQAPYINMAAALSVCSTVGKSTGLDASIKWPNDVKLAGRKVSGILVESMVSRADVEYTVLGVGLNVNSNPADVPEIAATATSMYRESGRTFDRTDILIELLQELDNRYALIRAGHSMKEEWSSRLETLGRSVIVCWQDSTEEGTATGVDEMGNLILTKADGTIKSVVAGEVTLQV